MIFKNTDIYSDRVEFKAKSDDLVGKTDYYDTYFREDLSSPEFTARYYKDTINGYIINHIKLKFFDDGSIEINYDGETTKGFQYHTK